MNTKKNKHLFACLIALIVLSTVSASLPVLGQERADSEENGGGIGFIVHLFREYISGADGDRCPMEPTCSRYSLDAIHKHGPFMGWIMTCDRLMRCGRDETRRAPLVTKHDTLYSHDPVENNDFWWAPAFRE